MPHVLGKLQLLVRKRLRTLPMPPRLSRPERRPLAHRLRGSLTPPRTDAPGGRAAVIVPKLKRALQPPSRPPRLRTQEPLPIRRQRRIRHPLLHLMRPQRLQALNRLLPAASAVERAKVKTASQIQRLPVIRLQRMERQQRGKGKNRKNRRGDAAAPDAAAGSPDSPTSSPDAAPGSSPAATPEEPAASTPDSTPAASVPGAEPDRKRENRMKEGGNQKRQRRERPDAAPSSPAGEPDATATPGSSAAPNGSAPDSTAGNPDRRGPPGSSRSP
jgi:hypothetical protein